MYIIMKKKLLFALTCLLIMSGCSRENPTVENGSALHIQNNSLGASSNYFMSETDTGTFYIYMDYLLYKDKESKDWVFVCDKPECTHDKEDVYGNCNAVMGMQAYLYNGKIYYRSYYSLMCADERGGNHELLGELADMKDLCLLSVTYKDNYCVFVACYFNGESKYHIQVSYVDLLKPFEVVNLYEFDKESDQIGAGVIAYDGGYGLYIESYRLSDSTFDSYYYRFGIEDKEPQLLAQMPSCVHRFREDGFYYVFEECLYKINYEGERECVKIFSDNSSYHYFFTSEYIIAIEPDMGDWNNWHWRNYKGQDLAQTKMGKNDFVLGTTEEGIWIDRIGAVADSEKSVQEKLKEGLVYLGKSEIE